MGAKKRGPASVPAQVDIRYVEKCAWCHNRFTGHARPRWAFSRNGYPAGRVHALCATHVGSPLIRVWTDQSFDEAWYSVWVRHIRKWGDTQIDWDIQTFVHHPTETLSQQQESDLIWKLEHGRTAEQIEELREAHTALIREFFAWRGSL